MAYVGQTKLSPEQRFKQHVIHAKKSMTRLHRAMRESPEHFRIEQIDAAETQADLDAKEKLWIESLMTLYPGGYNHTRGGRGLIMIVGGRPRPDLAERNREGKGKRWTDEQKAAVKLIRSRSPNPNLGRKASAETREKIRLRALQRPPMPEEHRKKFVEATARRHAARRQALIEAGLPLKAPRKRKSKKTTPRPPVSQETKEKRSLMRRGSGNSFFGKTHSEETRKVLSEKCGRSGESNPFFGKKHSEETRAKIRAKRALQITSEATRAKMSATRKGVKIADLRSAAERRKSKG